MSLFQNVTSTLTKPEHGAKNHDQQEERRWDSILDDDMDYLFDRIDWKVYEPLLNAKSLKDELFSRAENGNLMIDEGLLIEITLPYRIIEKSLQLFGSGLVNRDLSGLLLVETSRHPPNILSDHSYSLVTPTSSSHDDACTLMKFSFRMV